MQRLRTVTICFKEFLPRKRARAFPMWPIYLIWGVALFVSVEWIKQAKKGRIWLEGEAEEVEVNVGMKEMDGEKNMVS